ADSLPTYPLLRVPVMAHLGIKIRAPHAPPRPPAASALASPDRGFIPSIAQSTAVASSESTHYFLSASTNLPSPRIGGRNQSTTTVHLVWVAGPDSRPLIPSLY